MMRKLSSPVRLAIAIGGLFILLAVVYLLAYRPKIKKLSQVRVQLTQIGDKLEDARRAVSEIEGLEKEELTNKLFAIGMKIPDNEDIPELLKELSIAAKGANISDITFETQPSTSKGGKYYTIPIRMRILSSYRNLAEFLEELKNMKRFVSVENLRVAREESDLPLLNINLQINAYYLKSEE